MRGPFAIVGDVIVGTVIALVLFFIILYLFITDTALDILQRMMEGGLL